MLNLISNEQMHLSDQYTINNDKIASIDLMEQAASAFVIELCKTFTPKDKITIITGKGNNGGDGLAIARILSNKGFDKISIYTLDIFKHESDDFKINKIRLKETGLIPKIVNSVEDFPIQFDVVIDAVLGTGFNKELSAELIEIFNYINSNSKSIISVDCPSGLNTDNCTLQLYQGIKANKTISFQRPKLIFTLPESQAATESFSFLDIGLNEEFIQQLESDYFWIEQNDIMHKIQLRESFTHKGTYGHLLVISGSLETLGATLLTAQSALFSGVGLVTIALDPENFSVINTAQPEIMTTNIHDLKYLNFNKFKTIAIGPGLGQDDLALKKLDFILNLDKQLVLDADALNLIAKNEWLNRIPNQSILTPHLKEFDRLFGDHCHWIQRLETAKIKAKELDCIIVLKNQYTYIIDASGKVYINSTGNPGMAQGGMGDVLTGCISAFITRGLLSLDAAMVGTYIHGLSGDQLAEIYEVTPPSFIIKQLPKTIKQIHFNKKGSL